MASEYEPVFLDDGYGGRVERRLNKRGTAECARCGSETEWLYRRITSLSRVEKPYCSILCCERAIKHGRPHGI